MAVTRDDVAHIAALARLALDDTQITRMVAELNAILGHMDVLQRVETAGRTVDGAPPQASMPLRRDAGPPLALLRPIASFAPSLRDGFFLVPRLATHEDAAPEDLE
jgi:aspartyl-tRNA(Asn)/glutamyl-tRNA(Gln) amidotransferase subunit C